MINSGGRALALDGFEREYGAGGDISVFFAPLRVNLIGEYTDIAGGRVLPCALNFGIYAAVRAREDKIVRLAGADVDFNVSIDISEPSLSYDEKQGWANYPKGVLFELLKDAKNAEKLRGADIYYAADAAGFTSSGLSSSAAIEVLTGVVFNELFDLGIDGVSLALLSQRAENHFVGVMCGIMDQFAVMMGKREHAILLDCATLAYEYVPASLADYKLVIMNTNKKRGLLESKYNERRAEADSALSDLVAGGVIAECGCLCSIGSDVFEQSKHMITNADSVKRAKHLIYENERVKLAADALKNGDAVTFGELLDKSHESLKNDFLVTGKELDAIQQAARSHKACIGARMTGAGFGGCAIAVVSALETENFINEVSEKYLSETGIQAAFKVCEPSEGAGVVL